MEPQHEKDVLTIAAMDQEIEEFEHALQDLVDVQNGPPLITLTKGWNEAMDAAISLLNRNDETVSLFKDK